MKCLKQYREIIKATDETIRYIVRDEIRKLGNYSDLNHIDVSGVTNTTHLFHNFKFNGHISNWNVGNIQYMNLMFHKCSFNGDISKWDVHNVRDMSLMFWNSPFNGDISPWDVSNVINMRFMFNGSEFNGDLSLWNVGNVLEMRYIFDKSSSLCGQEPWWYVLYPLFGSPHLMWDSLDFRWIDLESKIIYGGKLSKILQRSYNTKWNGELPQVFGFTYQ